MSDQTSSDELIKKLETRATEHRRFFGSRKDYELFEIAAARIRELVGEVERSESYRVRKAKRDGRIQFERAIAAEAALAEERAWRERAEGALSFEGLLAIRDSELRTLARTEEANAALLAENERLRGALAQIATYWDHLIECARPDDALVLIAAQALEPPHAS